MKKKILLILFSLIFALSTVSASATAICEESELYSGTEPKILIGYRYVPGYDQAVFLNEILDFVQLKYVVLNVSENVSGFYEFTQSQTYTSSATWNIATNFTNGFDFQIFSSQITVDTGENQTASVTIHSGEVLKIDQDALIIGQINPGAIVRFSGKLYVMGRVSGFVEGMTPNSRISGQCFKNAHIRINGVSRQSYTSFELTMLYYKDSEIFLDKGDMIYV